jgi:hypothetical protein
MSLEWWITPHEKTRSNEASANGSRSASSCRTSPSSPNASSRRRVVSTAQSVRSTAVTRAPASASICVAIPLPQPTSSTSRPASEPKSTKSENGCPLGPAVRRMYRGWKIRRSISRKNSCEPSSYGIGSSTSYDIGFRFHQSRTCCCVVN